MFLNLPAVFPHRACSEFPLSFFIVALYSPFSREFFFSPRPSNHFSANFCALILHSAPSDSWAPASYQRFFSIEAFFNFRFPSSARVLILRDDLSLSFLGETFFFSRSLLFLSFFLKEEFSFCTFVLSRFCVSRFCANLSRLCWRFSVTRLSFYYLVLFSSFTILFFKLNAIIMEKIKTWAIRNY